MANTTGAAKISKTCGKCQRGVRATLQAHFGGARRHTHAPVLLPQGRGLCDGAGGGRLACSGLRWGNGAGCCPQKRCIGTKGT